MIEQRQEYQEPVVEVLTVENRDIICSSTEPEGNSNFNGSSINKLQEGTL